MLITAVRHVEKRQRDKTSPAIGDVIVNHVLPPPPPSKLIPEIQIRLASGRGGGSFSPRIPVKIMPPPGQKGENNKRRYE